MTLTRCAPHVGMQYLPPLAEQSTSVQAETETEVARSIKVEDVDNL